MTREIKFRGKRIDTGGWAHGQFLLDREGNPQIVERNDIGEFFHRVVSETVGQYTGLRDRNDFKIFEGDIIETVDVPNPALFEVIFNLQEDDRPRPDGSQSAEFCLKKIGADWLMCFGRSKKMQVLGSIHDKFGQLLGEEAQNGAE